MCTIIQEPHATLRAVSQPVADDAFGTKQLTNDIDCMKQALHREPDGVAIAAPQVDIAKRIFVVAGFVFDLKKKNAGGTPSPDRVFINPVITKRSKETKWMDGEGCLSVRWVYGTTKRHKIVTVRAQDETGKTFTMSGSGLLSQIFQHEIDHLDGVLFIDHAKEVRHMTDEEIITYQEELRQLEKDRN